MDKMHWEIGCFGGKRVIYLEPQNKYLKLLEEKVNLEILRGQYHRVILDLEEIAEGEKREVKGEISQRIIPYLRVAKNNLYKKIKDIGRVVAEIEERTPEVLNQTGGGNLYNAPKLNGGDQ